MIVKCSDCNVSFSVDDEKISGKKFAFDCPNCGHHNVIDNRIKDAVPASAPASISVPDDDFGEDSFVENTSTMMTDEFEIEDSTSSEDIEPEIDLSILNRGNDEIEQDSHTDDESNFGDEPVTLDENADDFEISDFDLPEEFFDEDEKTESLSKTVPGSDMDDFAPVESEMPDDAAETDFPKSDDESTTIDLDSLDIDLDGLDDFESGVSEKVTSDLEISEQENDDLTLDLNSLDINLEESDEIQSGENLDDSEDGRLSIEDAGLSLDELSAETPMEVVPEEDDDELRLSIDEIPGLDVDELATSSETALDNLPDENEDELRLSIDEIPGLDVDELASGVLLEEDDRDGSGGIMEFDDIPEIADENVDNDSLILDEFNEKEMPEVDFDKYEAGPVSDVQSSSTINSDMFEIDATDFDYYIEDNFDHSGKGFINFSIDYSLRYSRLKAFLRLIGVYYIVFIPHFIVLYVYTLLSVILGFLNWILILFSGRGDRDFYAIQEKTLRYNLSLSASISNIIEESPRFAGNTDLDDSLQMKAALPENPSRFLAAMRLSGIGIVFLTLPHLFLLTVLTFGTFLIWVISLLIVVLTGKWPNILFDFMVRYFRYSANVSAYLCGLSDSYPSFRFD